MQASFSNCATNFDIMQRFEYYMRRGEVYQLHVSPIS